MIGFFMFLPCAAIMVIIMKANVTANHNGEGMLVIKQVG